MKWILTMVTVFITVENLAADVAPLHPGTKFVKALHKIETEQEFPEYAFLLVRESWSDELKAYLEVPEFIELVPDRPFIFRLSGFVPGGEDEKSERASLRVVKRSRIKPGMSPQEVFNAGTDFLERFDFRELVPSWNRGKEVLVTYRVQRDQSGVGLEIVQTGDSPMFHWKIAAGFTTVALTLAILLFGILLLRSVFRRRPV